MCGIAGFWSDAGDAAGAAGAFEKVAAMTAAMAHRGPDDVGVEMVAGGDGARNGEPRIASRAVGGERGGGSGELGGEGGPLVVFGHRRLSILDLSAAGHQPMCDPVTGNWITYNGEIYNFPELRAELERRGHAFRSRCDTEAILKAYAEWGTGCWRRLRGIFAFGLWDARYRELHLVRDQLGVKPLYFARHGRDLLFASEVRALLASGNVARKLSPDGLQSFLKYGSVQEPVTMIDGVESLGPGSYLTGGADGGVATRHFWRPDEALRRNWEKRPVAADVPGCLQDSIGRQLIADVPVGVFLSGGIDSTVVAALAARAQPGAVRTFCIGTEEKASDESAEAAATAAALGCRHTTLVLGGGVVNEKLPAALRSYDQPSQDGINTYFIAMLVREAGMKVALSGLGGDELFVGYNGFAKALRMARLGRLRRWMPATASATLGWAMAAASAPGSAKWGTVAELLAPDLPDPYFASRNLYGRAHAAALLRRDWGGRPGSSAWSRRETQLTRAARDWSPIDRVTFFELQTYLVSTLLRDSDQMSMAHGLELRVPLIDPELVEHVLPIATEEKAPHGTSKRLLTATLRGLVPAEVLARPKRGFLLPFHRWLLEDLRGAAEACFLAGNPRGPWNIPAFRGVWENFRKGRVGWSRVMALFVLENWMAENGVTA